MGKEKSLKHWRFILHAIECTAGVLTPVVGASLKATAKDVLELGCWAVTLLEWVQHKALILLVLLPVLFAVVRLILAWIDRSWKKEHIQFLLNRAQDFVFEDDGKSLPTNKVPPALHHNRVTIFRRVQLQICLDHWPFQRSKRRNRWNYYDEQWPWSGWLVQVARSHHTTQNTKARFRAPDNADRVTGVAGRVWASGQVYSVHGLPDVSNKAKRTDIDLYAQLTGVSEEWIMKKKPKARSFCGIPVRVSELIWGVIVLDSRSSDPISPVRVDAIDALLSKYFGKLFSR